MEAEPALARLRRVTGGAGCWTPCQGLGDRSPTTQDAKLLPGPAEWPLARALLPAFRPWRHPLPGLLDPCPRWVQAQTLPTGFRILGPKGPLPARGSSPLWEGARSGLPQQVKFDAPTPPAALQSATAAPCFAGSSNRGCRFLARLDSLHPICSPYQLGLAGSGGVLLPEDAGKCLGKGGVEVILRCQGDAFVF